MKKTLLLSFILLNSILLFGQNNLYWPPQQGVSYLTFPQRDSLKKEVSEQWLIRETMYEDDYEIHLRQPLATELVLYMNSFLGIVEAKEINKYSLEVTLAEWYVEKSYQFPVIRSGLQIYFAGKNKKD